MRKYHHGYFKVPTAVKVPRRSNAAELPYCVGKVNSHVNGHVAAKTLASIDSAVLTCEFIVHSPYIRTLTCANHRKDFSTFKKVTHRCLRHMNCSEMPWQKLVL